MTSTVKQVVGSATSLASTGTNTLTSLGSGNYSVSDAINNTTNAPLDVLIELNVTATANGNKQVILWAISSLDGSNYSHNAAVSGANAETAMAYLGVVPIPYSSDGHRSRVFSLARAFDGVLPPYAKIVTKNDTSSAFTSASLSTAEVSGSIV